MSKENFIGFLRLASEKEPLQAQLKEISSPTDLVKLGKEHGHEFAENHVATAIAEIKAQPSGFAFLAQGILELFSPSSDHFPSVGAQPFSGDISKS